jgi:hypothetical protein
VGVECCWWYDGCTCLWWCWLYVIEGMDGKHYLDVFMIWKDASVAVLDLDIDV